MCYTFKLGLDILVNFSLSQESNGDMIKKEPLTIDNNKEENISIHDAIYLLLQIFDFLICLSFVSTALKNSHFWGPEIGKRACYIIENSYFDTK